MTREEAINEIKSWDFLEGKEIEAIHTLIPELAESEEEKFQKYILKVCKECVDANDKGLELSMSTTKKLLAYLEKQKEKKTADNVSKEEYVKRFKSLCDAYEIKLPNREYDINHLCDDLSKLSVDSGKQKPVERSEEDEKIRKALVWHVKADVDFVSNGVTKAECLAYLEKQKEKKTAEWSEEEKKFIKHCAELLDGQGEPMCALRLESLRPQSKQEWSEEDETHRNFILESLEDQIRFCKKDAEGAYYTKQIRTAQNWLKSLSLNLKKRNEDVAKLCSNEWSEEDKKVLLSIINAFRNGTVSTIGQEQWLKSLPERFSLQPKQEWNEEDEKLLNKVEAIMDSYCEYLGAENSSYYIPEVRETISQLKSLPHRFNPQPKVEWSEEDKETIDDIFLCLEMIRQDYPMDDINVPNGNMIDKAELFLKSLHPQYHGDVTMTVAYKMGLDAGKASSWKPSKEQMRILNWAANGMVDKSIAAPEMRAVLRELYDQLKKLI